MFSKALVRTPCPGMIHGLTTANLGSPDLELALQQHQKYIEALKSCGLEVIVLPPLDDFPDSTFIEDVAVLTRKCAIITYPGAESRRDEIIGIKDILEEYYTDIERISFPGTLEAGDVMMVGDHFYIGLSERTNSEGADQLITILEKFGLTGSVIQLKDVLHLKTGLAYLENNNLVAFGEFLQDPEFQKFNILEVDIAEGYAANCIWVNDKVLVPGGYPKSAQMIEDAGYDILEVDVSEFRKLDGGLSCLSLRF